MSKIEELFEKKLSGHSLAPSPSAWDSIEAGLSKKNDQVIWIRWAAIFLLGGLLFTTLWLRQSDENKPVAKILPEGPPQKDAKVLDVKPVLAIETKKALKSNSVKKNNPVQPSAPQIIQGVVPDEKLNDKEVEVAMVNSPVPMEKNTSPQTTKSIVLVYTLDTIEPSKHETPTEAVAADKKDGIKKMMRFARDVKSGDSPLGIRDMKDELFALDFKKSTKKQH